MYGIYFLLSYFLAFVIASIIVLNVQQLTKSDKIYIRVKLEYIFENMFSLQGKLHANTKQIGHYLVIENVTKADTGYYMCTAINRAGTDIKAVHIQVISKHLKVVETCIKNNSYFTEVGFKSLKRNASPQHAQCSSTCLAL